MARKRGKQLTLPGPIVKKDNKLARARLNISNLEASRILASLIACIRTDAASFASSYEINARDIIADPGGHSYTIVKKWCKELAGAYAEIETPDPDGPHPIFQAMPFFTNIKYKKGIIEASFNPVAAPMLLELKRCFTQYNLLEYLSLPSIYSQRLFEILKSWEGMPEVTINIRELHRMLNTPKSFRSDYRQFRLYVLEKAYSDINEKTSLSFEWQPIKVGKSVEKIRFLFSGKAIAIADEEKEKLRKEKQQRLHNQRLLKALNCAKSKLGDCQTRDNRPIICKICCQFNICEEIASQVSRLPKG